MRTVELAGLEPLSAGSRRLVFQHPWEPGLLVKVMRPGSFRPDGQPLRSKWYKRRRREGAFIHHRRELVEYLAARVGNGSCRGLPVCVVEGLAETDLGLGLVVEKIAGRDGSLAPTLRQVVERRLFDSGTRALFERFIDDLVGRHVVVHELSVDNIVLADDDRGRRFVCVDGTGSRTLFPLREWSKWINARDIRRFRAEFLRDRVGGAPRPTAIRAVVRQCRQFPPSALAALLPFEILL